jgi:hypothetical protein
MNKNLRGSYEISKNQNSLVNLPSQKFGEF